VHTIKWNETFINWQCGSAIALGSPIVVYLTGMAWNKTVGAPWKVNQAWTTFCLVLPIAALGMLVQPSTLRRLWSASPYTLLLLAIVFGLCVPVGLIIAIVLVANGPNRHGQTALSPVGSEGTSSRPPQQGLKIV
jgi:hypothetical protein